MQLNEKLGTWDIDKSLLRTGSVQATANLIGKYEQSKPGDRIIDCPLSDHVRFAATRSSADEDDPSTISLLLNIFHDETEAGQIELRYDRTRSVWMIPDRQTNEGFEERGIFSALLAAGERFFSDIAERSGPHAVEVTDIGQKKLIGVFEHKGYEVLPGHEEDAELVRHPEKNSDVLVERHAWSLPHPKSGSQVLNDDRDPWVFRKEDIANIDQPTFRDALRVRLTKTFHPVTQNVSGKLGEVRSALSDKLT